MRIKFLRELQDATMKTKAVKLSKREPLNFKDKISLFFGNKTYDFLGVKHLVYSIGNEEYFIFNDGTKQKFKRVWLK